MALNFNLMGLGFHFFVQDDATLGLQRIDKSMKNVTADAEEMYYKTKASLDALEPKLGALGDARVQAALRGTGMALAGIGAAGIAAAGLSVKSFGDFEQEMLNARSVARWTEGQFKDLSKYAIQVGADTKFSAKEAAGAIYEIASAGVSATEDIKALLRPIADFAAAGAIQLPEATRAIVASVQGFRMQMSDAAHISDVFTAAIQNSMLKANEFDVALGSVAGVAGQVGQSLEATMSGLMAARNVIGSAQDAATSLRTALMHLTAPTSEAANIMDVLGINLRDAQGNMKPWPQIIREFELSFAAAGKLVNQFASFADANEDTMKALAQTYGLTKDQAAGLAQAAAQGTNAFRDYVLATVFGTDGIRAVAAGLSAQAKAMIDGKEVTLQGADALEYWQEKLEGSAGAAQQAAAVQMSGFNGAMEQLRGSVEAVGLTIGNTLAPTVSRVAGIVEKAVDIFNRMPEGLQKAAAWALVGGSALALFAGTGFMVVSMIPSFITGLTILKGTFVGAQIAILGARAAALAYSATMLVVRGATQAWAGAQWVLNAALNANPIGIIIIAATALAGVAFLVWRNWDKVKGFFRGIWPSIAAGIDFIKGKFAAIPGAIAAFVRQIPGFLGKLFLHDIPYWIGYGIGFMIRIAWQGIQAVVNFFARLPGRVIDFVTNLATQIPIWWNQISTTATQIIGQGIDAVVGFFASLPGRAWTFLISLVNTVVSVGSSLWHAAYRAGSNIVHGIIDTIAGLPGKVWEILQSVINTITGKINDFWKAAKTAASNLWEGFKAGLGIHSPSYIERALTNITEASQATVQQLDADFRRLSGLSAEPQVRMGVVYSSPTSPAPIAPIATGTLSAAPVISTRVKQERSEAATAVTHQVIVRQPIKIVLDGRTIAETVIEFIEDAKVRRVVPA
ncbi:phage tail tape measure protein [Biomaibacter acetigenes]|uniref:Phage tail tape measure protein n=1 Tax=Biomaibacter acetigenes TaxID=2316383 RepID=A0A3G2R573_9FIRM|nr:phage tail tape measure protein [Biomaibacter acetigenes]AYO30590.1 phage tail tape measure protein [Biomaibacter acetigenes]